MNIPDVNVLIALHRPDHVHHSVATAWWRGAEERGEPYSIPDVVSMGFVRIVTGKSFEEPTTLEVAWQFLDALAERPLHIKYVNGPDTLAHCRTTSLAARARGKLLSDAYIAACAMNYGATVVTFDRDFRKFDNLRVTELAG